MSGEYAMISKSGEGSEMESILMETLLCMRRAGKYLRKYILTSLITSEIENNLKPPHRVN